MCTLVKAGCRPILVLTVHWNCARSPTDSRRWHEVGTKSLNEKLNQECRYYTFIYTGVKSELINKIDKPLTSLIDKMRKEYGKIGVLSIHRRDNKRLNKDPQNIFELGTLVDLTMNPSIVSQLKAKLKKKNITFDEKIRFIGGKEIKFLHKNFNNDPEYIPSLKKLSSKQRKDLIAKLAAKHSSHRPGENELQIAQLEFAGRIMNKDARKKKDLPFITCKILGDLLIGHFKKHSP